MESRERTIPSDTYYRIHPTRINNWKWRLKLIEQAAELFARSDDAGKDKERRIDDLHRTIGQLLYETRNFFPESSIIERTKAKRKKI